MTTYADVLGQHDIAIPAHLAAQAEIPVLTGLQAQGDVIVVPTRKSARVATPVPAGGVAVVRGESGGNTHLLIADGDVMWSPVTAGGQDLGVLTVPEGGVAYLLHPEHGANAMGTGCYVLRRQREQADEIRLVQD